jgi:universal stress protein E
LNAPAPHPQALRYAERDQVHAAIQKIMVVIDPTQREQPALEKAVRIAASYRSSLELYICDVEQDIPESWVGGSRSDEYREILRRRLLEDLERLAEPLRARGLDVRTACEWHAPLEQGIGHHVIRTQPDLVVKETHWHAAMPRVTLTRTDWNLIRQVPAPLLLVRRKPWPEHPRIAVSVDPCHPADRPAALDEAMVDEGRSIANALTGEVDVVHVLQTPPHLPGEKVPAQQKAAVHASARSAVERLARRADCSVRFGEGDPATGIIHLARESNANVLVMGAVARPRWVHSAASGTAAQILERIDCDLLIVKPPGFVSPLLVTDD